MDNKNEDTLVRQIEENLSNQINENYPLFTNDYINNTPITLSRAEYIRQAREACLRQLSNAQVYSRPYDVNYMDTETLNPEQNTNKKQKTWKLFQEGTEVAHPRSDDNSAKEIASFRSLVIRMVFAVVLFVAIFIIDNFELKIGNITNEVIQEYVTGNDQLQELENILVTWLK